MKTISIYYWVMNEKDNSFGAWWSAQHESSKSMNDIRREANALVDTYRGTKIHCNVVCCGMGLASTDD